MPTILQFRRGSTAQNDAFTGAVGELSIDTTKDTLRIHDGSTLGGFEIASIAATQTLTNKTLSSPTFSGTITGNLIPSANVTYDLGSSTAAWNNLYLAGNTIFIGDATISYDSSTGFQFLDETGNTATISLTTDDVTEGTNLYYTTSRANTDIDARVTKTFVDNLNVDADTLDGNDSTYFTNASNLASGTVPTARLGTGTANSTTYLAGDQTWKSIESGVTVVDDTSTNATRYVTFSDQTTGSESTLNVSSTKLTFNPSTGTLSATDLNSTSDIRLKKDINTIENAAEKVAALRGVNFTWKETDQYSMGLIAQEVEEIIPEVVSTNIEGQKALNYQAIIGLLIEAIKDLQKKIDS